jgi:hypothetical protein
MAATFFMSISIGSLFILSAIGSNYNTIKNDKIQGHFPKYLKPCWILPNFVTQSFGFQNRHKNVDFQQKPWKMPICESDRNSHTKRSRILNIQKVSASGLDANRLKDFQDSLWTALDVLPAMDSTPLRLAVTQSTAAYNLGFIATRRIELGEILVSVPWQFAISVDAEDRRGGPSDLRLALRLLSVLGDGGPPPEDARGRVWRRYADDVLSQPNYAAVLWDDAEIEELQFEDAIEYVRALKGQVCIRPASRCCLNCPLIYCSVSVLRNPI